MMWCWDHGTAWWGWLLMSLGMVAFWGGVIGIVWYLVTRAGPRRPSTPPRSPARILDERLARGEIGIDEYRTRGDALRAGAGRELVGVAGQPTGTASSGRRN